MVSSPRIPAGLGTSAATPMAQAEYACEVVAILGRLEDHLVAGSCGTRGARADPLSLIEMSLTEMIDHLSHEVVRPESHADHAAALVTELVLAELAHGLPLVLRAAGRRRPRWALAVHARHDARHDERGGGRHRTLALVRATHRRLGGAPRHPSAHARRPAPEPH